MTAILAATILVGLATTYLLYRIHLKIFAIRYGLAVFTAYAAFVGFIKIWLWYVEYCGRSRSSGTADDWFDCINFSGSGSSSGSGVSFSGGGGKFARHAHRATCGDWIGGVIKKTAIPFVLILALSVTMGWWAQHICPSALRLKDALHCIKTQ